MFELEGGDVSAADDLVVRVHVPVGAVRLGVFDLLGRGGAGVSEEVRFWGVSEFGWGGIRLGREK